MTLWESIRERAVEVVDQRHGYTIEHSHSPDAHAMEYDDEEAKLRLEVAEDPGLAICHWHKDRTHPLGGGIFVCFGCWARLLLGGNLPDKRRAHRRRRTT